jgi:hypothetical protein
MEEGDFCFESTERSFLARRKVALHCRVSGGKGSDII